MDKHRKGVRERERKSSNEVKRKKNTENRTEQNIILLNTYHIETICVRMYVQWREKNTKWKREHLTILLQVASTTQQNKAAEKKWFFLFSLCASVSVCVLSIYCSIFCTIHSWWHNPLVFWDHTRIIDFGANRFSPHLRLWVRFDFNRMFWTGKQKGTENFLGKNFVYFSTTAYSSTPIHQISVQQNYLTSIGCVQAACIWTKNDEQNVKE